MPPWRSSCEIRHPNLLPLRAYYLARVLGQSVPIAAIKLLVLRYVELKLSQIVLVLSKIEVELNETLLQNKL